MTQPNWRLERTAGRAADLHLRPLPDRAERLLWWHEVTSPAVALGSSQPEHHLDLDACRSAGVEVVRRRSGGGAVLLDPGDVLWVDVIVPAGDPLWVDDVVRSFHWLGRCWADALVDCGVADVEVHEGPLVRSRWSSVVCFAGMGPGEVTVGGRKVVGISQRRTRHAARFQCAVLGAWRPERLVGLLDRALGVDASELLEVATGCSTPLNVVLAAVLAQLEELPR